MDGTAQYPVKQNKTDSEINMLYVERFLMKSDGRPQVGRERKGQKKEGMVQLYFGSDVHHTK